MSNATYVYVLFAYQQSWCDSQKKTVQFSTFQSRRLTIWRQTSHRLNFGCDGLGRKVSLYHGPGAPLRIQGIDEARALVANVRQGRDVERGHHLVVLVHQVVAVEHVLAGVRPVLRLDPHRLADVEPDDVLEALRLVVLHAAVAAARARQDLEVDEVHVDGVRPAAAAVDKVPDLDRVARRPGEDAVVDVAKRHAVDLPLAALALEPEGVVGRGARGHPGDGAQRRGQLGRVGRLDGLGHDELHHLVGVEVRRVGGDLGLGAQRDVLPGEGAEVDDHLVALGHGDGHGGRAGGRGEEAGVGSNHVERNPDALRGCPFKVEDE